MKKIFLPMLFAAFMTLTSCGPTPGKLAEKISENKEFTQKDYSFAISHTSEFMNVLNDTIEKYAGNRQALAKALSDMQTDEKYALDNSISLYLQQINPDALDEENRAAYDKLIAEQEKLSSKFYEAMGFNEAMQNVAKSMSASGLDTSIEATDEYTPASGERQLENSDTTSTTNASAAVPANK